MKNIFILQIEEELQKLRITTEGCVVSDRVLLIVRNIEKTMQNQLAEISELEDNVEELSHALEKIKNPTTQIV